ncbi:hypothetical protein [Geobacillus sp. BK01]|uniref:hypothetical protein n=1 Tax=Geobacillus sp. BK01 TaxID=3457328 RepID=UPI003FA58223
MSEVLALFARYTNRQVVVNFYEDDELVARDGFFFDYMERSDQVLTFFKNGQARLSIPLADYPDHHVLKSFSRYYRLEHSCFRRAVELYFPS